MKNKVFGITIFLFIGILIAYITTKHLSTNATKVFYDSIESIVELKSFSESQGENYGTAVFIDDEGTLVTNAHVILYKKTAKKPNMKNMLSDRHRRMII